MSRTRIGDGTKDASFAVIVIVPFLIGAVLGWIALVINIFDLLTLLSEVPAGGTTPLVKGLIHQHMGFEKLHRPKYGR